MRAIKKWKHDLISCPLYVYTDHKMLLNFSTQKDLSQRQARRMEELSIYDCKFIYICGQDNTMADALSHYPSTQTCSESVTERHANHPHIGFDEHQVFILDLFNSFITTHLHRFLNGCKSYSH